MDTVTRTPSKYQQAIYDQLLFFTGNIFVSAVAGSGKTSTLEGICNKLTPMQLESAIFLAFNKAIQMELERRLPQEVWVKTFHSIAMMCLRKAIEPAGREWLDDKKYYSIIRGLLDARGYMRGDARDIVGDALNSATRMARLTLVDLSDDGAFATMCTHYDIELIPGLRELTAEILQRGADEAKKWIDFTDMIYLPIRLNIDMKKFSLLMVDEAQDLSACQRELVRRMMHPNSRLIAVGDCFQAIYSFAGADSDSVERICEEFDCKRMPLSVCYRCPSSHLDLAREIVPTIENRDNAPVGDVRYISYEEIPTAVNAARGDLVMCRTNAPLVELAFALLAEGIPVALKGRDLLGQLVNLAKHALKLPGANWTQFQSYLEEYVERQSQALGRKEGTEMQVQALRDRADALGIIVARAQALDQRITRIEGLEKFIERLYGSENGAVVLSSIHKAKGLEADHTFILAPELLPHPMAKTDASVEQEMHLKYVGLTRAKKSMTFIPLPE